MARKCGENEEMFQDSSAEEWIQSMKQVLQKFKLKWMEDVEREVAESAHHQLYAAMNRDVDGGRAYLKTQDINKIRPIFRARAEMLLVNYRWWEEGESNMCSMCNRREDETVFHFMALCPVLNEFRASHLKKSTLTRTELIDVLNGKVEGVSYDDLVKYIRTATSYRKFMVEEFNYDR